MGGSETNPSIFCGLSNETIRRFRLCFEFEYLPPIANGDMAAQRGIQACFCARQPVCRTYIVPPYIQHTGIGLPLLVPCKSVPRSHVPVHQIAIELGCFRATPLLILASSVERWYNCTLF